MIVLVKSSSLFQGDLKNLDNGGFREGKDLMFIHGEHLANVNILILIIIQFVLINVKPVLASPLSLTSVA